MVCHFTFEPRIRKICPGDLIRFQTHIHILYGIDLVRPAGLKKRYCIVCYDSAAEKPAPSLIAFGLLIKAYLLQTSKSCWPPEQNIK